MKKILLLGVFASAFMLSACGDGWEMRPYNNTPYGDRTAGSGVEYVRAHMMPKKGPVVEQPPAVEAPPPVMQPQPEPEPAPPPVTSGDNVFQQRVKK